MKTPNYFEKNGCLYVQFGAPAPASPSPDMAPGCEILLSDFMQQWL